MQPNSINSESSIPKGKISLRPARMEDCETVWKWANDPVSREASFSSELIPWEHHTQWYKSKLEDSQCIFLMILQDNRQPVGTVRFDVNGDIAIISINIAPQHRGHGVGRQSIVLSSELLFKKRAAQTIHAFIKTENTRSINAFANSGYINLGLTTIRNNPAFDFVKRLVVDE